MHRGCLTHSLKLQLTVPQTQRRKRTNKNLHFVFSFKRRRLQPRGSLFEAQQGAQFLHDLKKTYSEVVVGNASALRFTANSQEDRSIWGSEIVKELIISLIKPTMILKKQVQSNNERKTKTTKLQSGSSSIDFIERLAQAKKRQNLRKINLIEEKKARNRSKYIWRKMIESLIEPKLLGVQVLAASISISRRTVKHRAIPHEGVREGRK